MHKFGDIAIYVKDGKPLNALVAKAQGDSLNLLYLDPSNEASAFQGNIARIVSCAVDVKPLAPGAKFGWIPADDKEDYEDYMVHLEIQAKEPAPVMPADPTSIESVDDAKATALAAQINANLGK